MRKRLPHNSELQKFLELVRSIKEPEVKRYLLRAFHSFREGHLEAAVVLAWAGVERYCHLVAHDIGLWYFEWHFRENEWRTPERWELRHYEQVSSDTSIFVGLTKKLETLRSQRHKVAHGTGEFFAESCDVLNAVVSVRPIIIRSRVDEKFSDPLAVARDLKSMNLSRDEISKLIRHFPHNTPWQQIFDESIDDYLKAEDPKIDIDTIRFFIQKLYDMSDSSNLELWASYMQKSVKFLTDKEYSPRSKSDICTLLPIPQGIQTSEKRDQFKQFCECLIEWFEAEINRIGSELKTTSNDLISKSQFKNRLIEAGQIVTVFEDHIPQELDGKYKEAKDKWRKLT